MRGRSRNGIEIGLPAEARVEAVDVLRRKGYVVYVMG